MGDELVSIRSDVGLSHPAPPSCRRSPPPRSGGGRRSPWRGRQTGRRAFRSTGRTPAGLTTGRQPATPPSPKTTERSGFSSRTASAGPVYSCQSPWARYVQTNVHDSTPIIRRMRCARFGSPCSSSQSARMSRGASSSGRQITARKRAWPSGENVSTSYLVAAGRLNETSGRAARVELIRSLRLPTARQRFRGHMENVAA